MTRTSLIPSDTRLYIRHVKLGPPIRILAKLIKYVCKKQGDPQNMGKSSNLQRKCIFLAHMMNEQGDIYVTHRRINVDDGKIILSTEQFFTK